MYKRQVGRTEADLQIFLKEVTQEVVQRAFQVGKADVGINNQTFHLMNLPPESEFPPRATARMASISMSFATTE